MYGADSAILLSSTSSLPGSSESGQSIASTTESDKESGASESAEPSSSSSSTSTSILDRLRAPRASDLARKRKVKANPPLGKRRCSARGSGSELKTVTASERVKKHPNESLVVSAGKLFCSACREEVSLKSSVIANHIKSAKHEAGKERLKQKEAREADIASALRAHNEAVHLKGETQQQIFRVKVVSCFLRAGVPLSKVDLFRSSLEETAFRLTDRQHLIDYVPMILQKEQATIREEIFGRYVSVIFDGSSRMEEALAVIIRFISNEFTIEQRLVKLQMLAKSMKGEEIARELITVLSATYGIASGFLGAMKDRASVNNVALTTLKVVYPKLVDVGCYSHTINRIGERFSTPTLS